MSTGVRITENPLDEKKFQHYKNLHELEKSDAKPVGWDEAKPFKSIPRPKPVPIFGNIWRFLPKIGNFHGLDFVEIQKLIWDQHGDIAILEGLNGPPMVMLFNPKYFETLHRNEGVWPIRRGLASLDYFREMRKYTYPRFGMVQHQGEEWFKYRSVVNPILMQPRNNLQYVDKMNLVADELVDNVKFLAEQHNGEMPDNFNNELYKWSLESVGVVTLDKHLGCLKRDLDSHSETQQLIQSVLQVFELTYKLDILPSMYKYVSTSNWRKLVKALDFILKTNVKYINQTLDKLQTKEIDINDETSSVLQKLLKLDRNVAVGMSIDMMLAGIDTTGRVLAAGLYYLSKNPEKQTQLRNEAVALLQDKDTPITKEILAKASYLQGVIKEVTRLAPIAVGNLRTTVKNLIFGGYQVPSGTDVFTCNLALCTSDDYFPRAKEFLPERWLASGPKELSHKNTNPFVFLPFGFGPRSCIGKRLAHVELQTALLKIIRNFELQWPHEDMTFTTTALYGITQPLKLHVKCVSQ
jgi:cytochrome P450 family 12